MTTVRCKDFFFPITLRFEKRYLKKGDIPSPYALSFSLPPI